MSEQLPKKVIAENPAGLYKALMEGRLVDYPFQMPIDWAGEAAVVSELVDGVGAVANLVMDVRPEKRVPEFALDQRVNRVAELFVVAAGVDSLRQELGDVPAEIGVTSYEGDDSPRGTDLRDRVREVRDSKLLVDDDTVDCKIFLSPPQGLTPRQAEAVTMLAHWPRVMAEIKQQGGSLSVFTQAPAMMFPRFGQGGEHQLIHFAGQAAWSCTLPSLMATIYQAANAFDAKATLPVRSASHHDSQGQETFGWGPDGFSGGLWLLNHLPFLAGARTKFPRPDGSTELLLLGQANFKALGIAPENDVIARFVDCGQVPPNMMGMGMVYLKGVPKPIAGSYWVVEGGGERGESFLVVDRDPRPGEKVNQEMVAIPVSQVETIAGFEFVNFIPAGAWLRALRTHPELTQIPPLTLNDYYGAPSADKIAQMIQSRHKGVFDQEVVMQTAVWLYDCCRLVAEQRQQAGGTVQQRLIEMLKEDLEVAKETGRSVNITADMAKVFALLVEHFSGVRPDQGAIAGIGIEQTAWHEQLEAKETEGGEKGKKKKLPLVAKGDGMG